MESLGETGSSPRIDRIVARCKVAGTGQESPISFNSQRQANWPSKMAMNPVRLWLTVKGDQAYNLFWQGATKSCSCLVKRCSCS
jgi:hypothetical protein